MLSFITALCVCVCGKGCWWGYGCKYINKTLHFHHCNLCTACTLHDFCFFFFFCLFLLLVAAFLISKHQMPGSALLLLSSLPASRFSFAIVGINITELQYRLMMKRKLRTHFYNLHSPQPSVDTYHEVYCKFPQKIQSNNKNHTNWKFTVVSITLTAVASTHSNQEVCGEFTIQHRYWRQMYSHISVLSSTDTDYKCIHISVYYPAQILTTNVFTYQCTIQHRSWLQMCSHTSVLSSTDPDYKCVHMSVYYPAQILTTNVFTYRCTIQHRFHISVYYPADTDYKCIHISVYYPAQIQTTNAFTYQRNA